MYSNCPDQVYKHSLEMLSFPELLQSYKKW